MLSDKNECKNLLLNFFYSVVINILIWVKNMHALGNYFISVLTQITNWNYCFIIAFGWKRDWEVWQNSSTAGIAKYFLFQSLNYVSSGMWNLFIYLLIDCTQALLCYFLLHLVCVYLLWCKIIIASVIIWLFLYLIVIELSC